MKSIFIMTALCSLFYLTTSAQDGAKADFQVRMNQHIAHKTSDPAYMTTAKELYGHTCDKHHTVTDEDIMVKAAEAEKHRFIQANMEEYMRLYFPAQVSTRSITADTFICDNGGFENDFLYYKGYSGLFNYGSLTCTPYYQNAPTVFLPAVLPTLREFEIVTSGTDALTGLQKVKYGNKAIKINDLKSHVNGGCDGDYGINKLVKRFLVTKENREFTVWYSLALENPTGHGNAQPYFSIKCDKAPYSDLCFDAEILECDSVYNQPICGQEKMDVLDWTCHRVKIPLSEVGNIATLEITMSDCGLSGHNAYAYVDGICEGPNCIGSALGSLTLTDQSPMVNGLGIDYISCNGDIAKICGSYTDPTLCGIWQLDSIDVPGLNFSNASIDTINKIFCFEIKKYDLPTDISEIFVAGYFKKNGGGYLPVVFSNSIYLDKSLFTQLHYVEFNVSECFNNKTVTNISDDYYLVEVKLDVNGSENWSISRRLLDLYPGESGISNLDSGSGTTNLILGPFLIQEGSWEMTVNIGDCVYKYIINPPPFCSGCASMAGALITDVTCIPGPPDQWSFNLFIPNQVIGSNGTYDVLDANGNFVTNGSYGVPLPITNDLTQECVSYRIKDYINDLCFINITVCPPIPCSDENCDLDVQAKVKCINDSPLSPYEVTLTIDNGGSPNACMAIPNTYNGGGTAVSSGWTVGPYSNDVNMVMFTCPGGDCTCEKPTCFKVIHIAKPDCGTGHFNFSSQGSIQNRLAYRYLDEVKVIPNPINNDELKVVSSLDVTEIKVLNLEGKVIFSCVFTGRDFTYDMTDKSSGVYFVQFIDSQNKSQTIKFIKH